MNEWSKEYSTYARKRQSPVNIDTKSIHGKIKNPVIFLNHAQIPKNMTLENNGHTGMQKIKYLWIRITIRFICQSVSTQITI